MQWSLQQINLNNVNRQAKTNGVAAIGDPFVSVYNGQEHIAYRVAGGGLQDCWYDGNWQQQTINLGQGAPCQVGPSIGVYNGQQHFVVVSGPPNQYGGDKPGFPPIGSIWDAWYESHNWQLQELNLAGNTNASDAAYTPPSLTASHQGPTYRVVVWTWGNQQHFTYQTVYGAVIDVFWDGSRWQQQTINTAPNSPRGNTSAVPAVGDVAVCVFRPNAAAGNGQEHVAYRDANGIIQDCWYDPGDGPNGAWKVQQINGPGGATNGRPAVGGPVMWTSTATLNASNYDNAQHFAYADDTGALWDAFYDGGWHLVQINSSAQGNSPPAVGGLSACVFFDEYQANQQHVVYRAAGGAVWDCWFDVTTNKWSSVQVNLGVATSGPAAVGDPFVWVYFGAAGDGQVHVTYRAGEGEIWDAFWVLPPDQPGGRAGP